MVKSSVIVMSDRHYIICADGRRRMSLDSDPTVFGLIDDMQEHGYPLCCVIHFSTVNPKWRAELSEYNNHNLGNRILCPFCTIWYVENFRLNNTSVQ